MPHPAGSAKTVELLRQYSQELRTCGVKSLALFGSVARGEAGPKSDVDILIEFHRPIGMIAFLRLRYRLQEILGCRVDLVTPKALKRQLRDRILAEVNNANQRLEISA